MFSNVGMPHILADLQGLQKPVYSTRTDSEGNETTLITGFEIVEKGALSKSEYDQYVYDLVAFLDYVSEPYRETRKTVGTWVLIFLFGFGILAYLLKKEYWKDVH